MTFSVSNLAGVGGAAAPAATSPKPPALNSKGSPELREAFTDFVGQTFFGEMLKQMRASVDKPEFFDGGMGEDIFQSQLDQILVERMTDVSGPSFSGPMFDLLMAKRA